MSAAQGQSRRTQAVLHTALDQLAVWKVLGCADLGQLDETGP